MLWVYVLCSEFLFLLSSFLFLVLVVVLFFAVTGFIFMEKVKGHRVFSGFTFCGTNGDSNEESGFQKAGKCLGS